jgi:hypothetical protein
MRPPLNLGELQADAKQRAVGASRTARELRRSWMPRQPSPTFGLSRPLLRAVVSALAVLISASGVAAQLARRGGEFQINTVTEGDQREAHLAPLPDGGFVAMWKSNGNVGARRFDADTQPLGPEFQVNTMPTNTTDPFPSFAAAPDGSLFFAWSAFRFPETPPVGAGIVGRRFDASGTPDGPEFQVTLFAYRGSGVVAAGVDEFVVAWTDDYDYSGRARRIIGGGLSSEFNLAPEGQQYDFAGAASPDGSYRVVWYGEPIAEMQGRTFEEDEPTSEVFTIDRVSSGYHEGPAICTHEDGDFVVAWSTYTPMGDVRARYCLFSASNIPVLGPLFVTPEETELLLQSGPAIACGREHDFVAFWSDNIANGIRGRGFNESGRLPGVDFTIRLTGDRRSDSTPIIRLTDGDLIVAWTDCGTTTGCDVFAQRYTFDGPTDCSGDCNRDRAVTVDELVQVVAIALDSTFLPESAARIKNCLPADINLDYTVTLDEVVATVGRALRGCE